MFLALDKILGPSFSPFLSVAARVFSHLSFFSVHTLYLTFLINQTCQSILRLYMYLCMAWMLKISFIFANTYFSSFFVCLLYSHGHKKRNFFIWCFWNFPFLKSKHVIYQVKAIISKFNYLKTAWVYLKHNIVVIY